MLGVESMSREGKREREREESNQRGARRTKASLVMHLHIQDSYDYVTNLHASMLSQYPTFLFSLSAPFFFVIDFPFLLSLVFLSD